MENKDRKSENTGRKKKLMAAAAALLLLLAGIGIGLGAAEWFGRKNDVQLKPEVDPDAEVVTEQEEESEEKREGIEIPGYPSLFINAGENEVSAILENPDGNPCYFVFELILSSSGESLYRSGLIPPGHAISGFSISRSLEAGEYDAVLRISTYSLEDGVTPMNGADMKTVLVVS